MTFEICSLANVVIWLFALGMIWVSGGGGDTMIWGFFPTN